MCIACIACTSSSGICTLIIDKSSRESKRKIGQPGQTWFRAFVRRHSRHCDLQTPVDSQQSRSELSPKMRRGERSHAQFLASRVYSLSETSDEAEGGERLMLFLWYDGSSWVCLSVVILEDWPTEWRRVEDREG